MPDSAQPRILVVDDNDANRLLVVETLAPDGMLVVEASSGAEALAAFAAEPFDVLLLDVRMPELDGFATLERLRELPGGKDVPVVFLTALRDVETFDRARAAGAVDFLTKPVRPTELLARVETLLRLQRLGAEVNQQFADLRRQRDDLLRVQLQKERLAAFVVHDLKNPLAAMRMHATACARTPGLPESARESAQAIREQCDRLHQLVMSLLDLSKADEGQLVARRGDFDAIAAAREVADELGVQARARRVVIAIALGDALHFSADVELMRRVLENLVDNALRHTPAGGTVSIEGEASATQLVLRVRDTGQGIPPALAERIFYPFVQLDAGTAATRSGRGLGLAFCRAAVVAHGGTIAVVPSATGTCFEMVIPSGADA